MIIRQFFDKFTAHSSYLIGSGSVCAIIDPRRDTGIYINEAKKLQMKITHVFETHLHADFISGHLDLAASTGSAICGPEKAGLNFSHQGLKDGDSVIISNIILRVIETPGHTPEMINFVISDSSVNKNDPFAVFTGDTLFVGDVGRPDLFPGRRDELTEKLYSSLKNKIFKLPDYCEIYPAHGAGSLCGGNIGSKRWSTLRFERNNNNLLKAKKLADFKEILFKHELPVPDHFKRCSEINRNGPSLLKNIAELVCLNAEDIKEMICRDNKPVICDIRSYDAFGGQHIGGAYNMDFDGIFGNYSGWLLPHDREIIIISENPEDSISAVKALRRVGIDSKTYYLNKGMDSWTFNGFMTSHIPQMGSWEIKNMKDRVNKFTLLDVRNVYEYEQGHIENAINIPVHELRYRFSEVDSENSVLVYCGSGKRSSLGCSILKMHGFAHVTNLAGGYNAFQLHEGRK
jgi:glyoxylase-like metal-dependent hydrolase (beta-lactamase superfamily II)/rhodanese-related sulfurtransferase